MSKATVKLIHPDFLAAFYFNADAVAFARELTQAGAYTELRTLDFPTLQGQDAAEEVFDLSNNPGRYEERSELYGQGRSLSVGDIVTVDGVDWLCCSMGWQKL